MPKTNLEKEDINPNVSKPEREINPNQEQTPHEDAERTDMGSDKCWNSFLSHLNSDNVSLSEKEERLVCKIDRDLADSLDDCDISNKCRSDLVNAIIRAFFETNINRLLKFRREKKSLFQNYNV